MTIDWHSTERAYNRDNGTNYTEKELFMSLYPRYSSQAIGQILFVSSLKVTERLRYLGIKILPKGRRSPTKWQIFMTIPTNVFDVIPLQEIADMLHTTVGAVGWYKTKRLRSMKYYEGKCDPIKIPSHE